MQTLSRTYLAHHELESEFKIIFIIIRPSLLQDSVVPGRSTLNDDLQMDSADMPVCLPKPFGPQRDMKQSASGLPRQVVHPVSEHSTLLSAKYQMPCLRLHMIGTCSDEGPVTFAAQIVWQGK